MNKTKNEVWKPWPGAWYIWASNLGGVRTLDRYVLCSSGKRLEKGRILKQRRDKDGYLLASFRIDGKPVTRFVHRLVAQTFIPNTNSLPQVNHKDCDRTNNCVDNLEWCDNSYNQRYREKCGVSQTEAAGHPVIVIETNALKISRFSSQNQASRELGINVGNLNRVLKGKQKQVKGYWFTNADDNAAEAVRRKFGDSMANKVAELPKDVEMQSS